MTQIFVKKSRTKVESQSFEIDTTGGIAMGKLVQLDADGKVVLATAVDKVIGLVDNMPEYRAANSTSTVALGDMATIALLSSGYTYHGVSSGTFSKGSYLLVSSGIVSGTTGVTPLIAFEASTASNQEITFLKN